VIAHGHIVLLLLRSFFCPLSTTCCFLMKGGYAATASRHGGTYEQKWALREIG